MDLAFHDDLDAVIRHLDSGCVRDPVLANSIDSLEFRNVPGQLFSLGFHLCHWADQDRLDDAQFG